MGEAEYQGGAVVRLVGAFQDITERRLLQERLAANERFLRKLTDSLPVRIAYVDAERRYRFLNDAHCRRFGVPREQALGHTLAELRGQPSPEVDAAFDAAFLGRMQRFEFVDMVEGHHRRIEGQLIPDIDDSGAVVGVFKTGVDITERSRMEQALRDLSATLRSVAEAIPACIAVVGADGCYRFVNTSCERWIGMGRDAIVGWPVDVLLGDTTTHFSVSYVPLWSQGQTIDGFVAVLQDITDHRLEQARLTHLSERDALTGLFNRAGFDRHLADLAANDDGRMAALLYIDLDHFKPVNDRYGHPAGDELLQRFGQALAGLVRPHDVTARLGGDEFAILLRHIPDASVAERVAASVVKAAARPFSVGGHPVHIGASVGVAVGAEGTVPADLVARADAALYEAKRRGRGTVALGAAAAEAEA